MATDTLMFDLLAKDSASNAFRDLARSATVAAGEMHAAFAEPVEAKIKTEGFDEYMAKLGEVKAANAAAVEELGNRSSRLVLDAEKMMKDAEASLKWGDAQAKAAREAARLATPLGRAGDMVGNLTRRVLSLNGAFDSSVGRIPVVGKALSSMSALLAGPALGLGGAVGAGAIVGVGGLASALTAAAGAGGILGLAVMGDVKGYAALKQQIDTVSKSLASATPGTASYAAKQKELAGLQRQMARQYGPLADGINAVSKAWDGFLGKTKGPVMRLMGEGLKIAADALKQFAPVADAAAKALEPLLHQMDAWVKSSGFKDFLNYLKTTGVAALVDFVHFLGELGKGFLDLMVALAPVGKAIADFLGHLSGNQSLLLLGTIAAGIGAAMAGISGPVGLAVAGIVALGAAMIAAWKHSAQFRAIATAAFHEVLGAVRSLVTAAQGFWRKWGADIKKFGLVALETFVKQAGHTLAGLLHVVAALLDALSGNWKGAWQNIKQAGIDIFKGIIAPYAGILHALESLFSATWHGIESVASSFWSWIKGLFSSGMGDLSHAVSSGVHDVEAFFSSLPGRITGALAGLAGDLFNIGVNAMHGLLNGLESLAGAVASKVASIASSIPGKFAGILGIHSPSRVMHKHGQNVMDGLLNGLKSREAQLSNVITRIANQITSALSFGQAFAGNVFSAGLPTTRTRSVTVPGQVHRQVVNGQTIITSTPATTRSVTEHLSQAQILAEMFHYQRGQLHQDQRLARQVRKLKHEGLSASLIAQMESAGTQGLAEIAALASASPAQVRRFNHLNAQTNKALSNAGAQAVSGKSMAALKREKAHEQAQIRAIRKALHGLTVNVHGGKLRVVG